MNRDTVSVVLARLGVIALVLFVLKVWIAWLGLESMVVVMLATIIVDLYFNGRWSGRGNELG